MFKFISNSNMFHFFAIYVDSINMIKGTITKYIRLTVHAGALVQ